MLDEAPRRKRMIGVYLDDDDRELLKRRAAEKGVDVSVEARMILRRFLRRESSAVPNDDAA